MVELIALVILGIIFPTCIFALVSAAGLFFWFLATGQHMQWVRPWQALLATIRLELIFLIVGGFFIGVAFGKALYLSFPIVVAVLTLCVGAVGFLYFLWKGIPRWMEWRNWIRVIFPAP
jgi:hypothetical protein